MATISELQQSAVHAELYVQQENKDAAKRTLLNHARKHGWTEDDQLLVSDMLGLDLPPSMLHSGTPQSFNGAR